MRLIKISDADDEPVTVDEVKEDLILTGTADDDLIKGYIKSSRQFVENYAKTTLLTQTWEVSFTPDELRQPVMEETQDRIPLPRSPIQTINTVTWIDEEGNESLLDETTDYRLQGDYLLFVHPEDTGIIGIYVVNYDAGYEDVDDVPEPFIIAIRIGATSHYENRESFVIPPGIRQLVGPLRRGRLL